MVTMMFSQPCKSLSVAQMWMPVSLCCRLIEAGDLPSLARRLTVIAYEDIGLANPEAQIHTVTSGCCKDWFPSPHSHCQCRD